MTRTTDYPLRWTEIAGLAEISSIGRARQIKALLHDFSIFLADYGEYLSVCISLLRWDMAKAWISCH